MKISAVLPAYNAADYIGEALDSVRTQTRPVDEIVVADDASTDDTLETIKRWSTTNDCPVNVVQLETNGGAGAARTAGFKAAQHELVAMLDSDDQWYPHMVESLAGHLQQDTSLAAAFGYREFVTIDGPTGNFQGSERLDLLTAGREGMESIFLSSKEAFLINLDSGVTSCSAAVASRQRAIDCGLFDQSLRTSQDREFFLRLSRQGPFVFVPRPMGSYRLHDLNTTHARHALKTTRNAMNVMVKLDRIQEELHLDAEEREAVKSGLDGAAQRFQYAASRHGLKEFFAARKEIAQTAATAYTPNPRLLARALWRSLFPDSDLA